MVFHNGSNYGYHFIIKEVAKEFEGHFKCFGENTDVHKVFCTNQKRTGKCWFIAIQMYRLQQNYAVRFQCTYRFYDEEINRFCMMLQKGVYA